MNLADLKIETFSKQSGGFIMAPPNSVRITHIPTRLFEESCEERSQHRNRRIAFERLSERVKEMQNIDELQSRERSLRRAIRRLVNAEINNSWKGSQHPDDQPAIDVELKRAKAALNRAIERNLK